jgi:hypothetical protein
MARYVGAHPAGEDQVACFRELRREHADVRAALTMPSPVLTMPSPVLAATLKPPTWPRTSTRTGKAAC